MVYCLPRGQVRFSVTRPVAGRQESSPSCGGETEAGPAGGTVSILPFVLLITASLSLAGHMASQLEVTAPGLTCVQVWLYGYILADGPWAEMMCAGYRLFS